MTLWRRVVIGVLVVMVGVPLLFAATMYASAWYYRWRAGQVLAVVKTLTPGVTTEAEYLRVVKPWQSLPDKQDVVHPGFVTTSNYPDWLNRACFGKLAEIVCESARPLAPVATFLKVIPIFANGQLAYLGVWEGQTPMRYRCCAFVQIYSKDYERTDADLPEVFGGYVVLAAGEGNSMWLTHVELDERATAAERTSALNFSFRCFTTYRTCRDAALFLRTVANR